MLLTSGHAGWRRKFDEHGYVAEESYFGIDGKPTLTNEGIATVAVTHDARGNEIERAFLGVDGTPTLGPEGVAGFRQAFDERGNTIKAEYLALTASRR
jgi:hypothetical protein